LYPNITIYVIYVLPAGQSQQDKKRNPQVYELGFKQKAQANFILEEVEDLERNLDELLIIESDDEL
jgi:hypothetical protein